MPDSDIAVIINIDVRMVPLYLKTVRESPLTLQDAKDRDIQIANELFPLWEEQSRIAKSSLKLGYSIKVICCYFQGLFPALEDERLDRQPSSFFHKSIGYESERDYHENGLRCERYYQWMGDQLRQLAKEMSNGDAWETDTKANWTKRFGMSETTLRNRRKEHPEAFRGEKESKSCEIRNDWVEKWTKKQADARN